MALPSIDIDKSIQKEMLSYKIDKSLIFNQTGYYAVGIFFIVMITCILFNNKIHNRSFITFIGILLIIWMVINLILTNVMVKMNNSGRLLSREKVFVSLNKFYTTINFSKNDQSIVRSTNLDRWSTGRVLSIIFTDDQAYLNITSFGRGMFSPFNGLSNYLKCKRIAYLYNSLH